MNPLFFLSITLYYDIIITKRREKFCGIINMPTMNMPLTTTKSLIVKKDRPIIEAFFAFSAQHHPPKMTHLSHFNITTLFKHQTPLLFCFVPKSKNHQSHHTCWWDKDILVIFIQCRSSIYSIEPIFAFKTIFALS